MGIPEPEYITTISNVNRHKERERHKRLENRLLKVFVTKKEDNIQNAYIQDNKRKLSWLTKQADCMGMGRQEASRLVYKASAIGSKKAIENVKTVLAH